MIFYNTNFVNTSMVNRIKITIVDEKTNENLSGVLDKKTLKYSDFNGQLILNSGQPIKLNLISYEEMNIKNVKNDTTIKMIPL